MGDSIKFAEYASPFWRENNYSGTLFSQASIIQEMYDHSTADYKGYALKGFLNGGTHTLSEEERKAKVILQLTKLSVQRPQITWTITRKYGVTNHLPFPYEHTYLWDMRTTDIDYKDLY
jgi:monoamine oxidase